MNQQSRAREFEKWRTYHYEVVHGYWTSARNVHDIKNLVQDIWVHKKTCFTQRLTWSHHAHWTSLHTAVTGPAPPALILWSFFMEVTTYLRVMEGRKDGSIIWIRVQRCTRVQYVHFRKYFRTLKVQRCTKVLYISLENRYFRTFESTKIFPYFHKVVRLRTCTTVRVRVHSTQLHNPRRVQLYTYTY